MEINNKITDTESSTYFPPDLIITETLTVEAIIERYGEFLSEEQKTNIKRWRTEKVIRF